MSPHTEPRPPPRRWREWVVPGILIACVVLVGAWQLMARASRRPFKPFDLTAADFRGFQPEWKGWTSRMVPVSTNDPAEPNIVAMEVRAGDRTTLVRLVHGYNMPTCMRIKSHTVEPVTDAPAGGPLPRAQDPVQVWRVTDPAGEVSIWTTTLLKAGDFSALNEDVRSLAFPRIDGPEDPRWIPRGMTRETLRHPLASLKGWFRTRWNSSRTDLLTFLRLRQPAWASEERLTFVVRSLSPAVTAANESAAIRDVLAVHRAAQAAFQQWRRLTLAPPPQQPVEKP
jgi:hypothetical protein